MERNESWIGRLLGALSLICSLFVCAIDWIARSDTVSAHIHDIGKVSYMLEILSNTPSWASPALAVLGIGLIAYDYIKRKRSERSISVNVGDDATQESAKKAAENKAEEPKRKGVAAFEFGDAYVEGFTLSGAKIRGMDSVVRATGFVKNMDVKNIDHSVNDGSSILLNAYIGYVGPRIPPANGDWPEGFIVSHEHESKQLASGKIWGASQFVVLKTFSQKYVVVSAKSATLSKLQLTKNGIPVGFAGTENGTFWVAIQNPIDAYLIEWEKSDEGEQVIFRFNFGQQPA